MRTLRTSHGPAKRAQSEGAERGAKVSIPGGKVIDLHAHLYAGREDEIARELLEEIDLLGAEYAAISYIFGMPEADLKVAQVRSGNDIVAGWAKRAQGRFRGVIYLNPRHGRHAVDELRRCYEVHGMRMVKLLCSVHITNPLVYPIIERTIAFNVPVLQHSFQNACGNGPNESYAWEVAQVGRRYPEARIVMAHIAGDYTMGTWCIRETPNVWTDISGTYCEAGMVETAVRELGASRVVLGSDNGIAFNIGKVRDARISEADKGLVLYYNAKRLLP